MTKNDAIKIISAYDAGHAVYAIMNDQTGSTIGYAINFTPDLPSELRWVHLTSGAEIEMMTRWIDGREGVEFDSEVLFPNQTELDDAFGDQRTVDELRVMLLANHVRTARVMFFGPMTTFEGERVVLNNRVVRITGAGKNIWAAARDAIVTWNEVMSS